jgi:hypothetical protein
MAPFSRLFSALLFGASSLAVACSSGDSGTDAAKICAAGDLKACVGTGQCKGFQACAADGQSYDPCVCSGAGGSSGTGGGASGGKGGAAATGGAATAGKGGATGGVGGAAGSAGVGGGGVGGIGGKGGAGAGGASAGSAGKGGATAGSGGASGAGNGGASGAGNGGASGAGNGGASGAGNGGASGGMSGAGGGASCDDMACLVSCMNANKHGFCVSGSCACTDIPAPVCAGGADGGAPDGGQSCSASSCSACCQAKTGTTCGACSPITDECTCFAEVVCNPPPVCDPAACGKACASGCGACVQNMCACADPSACIQSDGGPTDGGLVRGFSPRSTFACST